MLWSRSFTPAAATLATSAASPVNTLIRDALIEGRDDQEKYERDGYAIKWSFVNDLELIFVVRRFLVATSVLKCVNSCITGRVSAHSAADLCGRPSHCDQDPVCQTIPTVPRFFCRVITRWFAYDSNLFTTRWMELPQCFPWLGQGL